MAEQTGGSSITTDPDVPARAVAWVRSAWDRAERFHVELVCFPLVVAIYAAHLFLAGYDRLYGDASQYWELGKTFESNGHFSLVAFDTNAQPPRGYSLPLLNHFLQVVAAAGGLGSMTIIKLFGALLAATLGVVVAPRLARELFPNASIGVGSVLAFNILIFLFWRDHFGFPLSDFPALLAGSVAVIGLLRASPGGYLVAGLGLGLAVNIRPSYQPALLAALLVAAFFRRGSLPWRRRGGSVALVLTGALLASLPQMAINHHQYGSWSPSIAGNPGITGGTGIGTPGAKKSFYVANLSFGLKVQKYETFVGSPAQYPDYAVLYFDPATLHVAQRENVLGSDRTPRVKSFGQYAGIVLRNPAEMSVAYARRIFNGLDVKYPTPYVRNLENRPLVFSLLLYTLMFVAAARLLLPDARRALGRIRWEGLALLLLPCLMVIPSWVDPRYFLPAQLLVYMLVCFAPGNRVALFGGTVSRQVGLAVVYVAFVLACLMLSSSTQSNRQNPGPTLGAGAPATLLDE